MLLTFLIALPLLTACFIVLLRPKHLRYIEGAVFISLVLQLGFALALVPSVLSDGQVVASALFSVGALGSLLTLIITLVGFFVSLYSVGYLRAEVSKGIIGPRRARQYFLLLELFLFAMLLSVTTISPVVMWIAIEATTLSTAFLISFYNKPSATEAAWKYLIINTLGLLLSLLGTLIFLALPAIKTGAFDWQMLGSVANTLSPEAVKIAFIFILVGYGAKVGLVPMHTWKPDTYAKAPTPVVALLSGVLMNVAFFAILRFKSITDVALSGSQFTSELLIFFGVVSLVFSALIIFTQKNYKRLLAYSSIEHAGLLALGFGFGGIGILAALIHMVFHALIKALLFFSVGNIFLKYSSTKMKNVTGVLSTLPLTAPLFFAGFIGLLGFPPFGIFLTELSILAAGMTTYPYVVALALFVLAVVFFGFFKHITAMMFGPIPAGITKGESNLLTQLPLVLLLSLILVLSWHFPESISVLLSSAAESLTINP